MKKMLNTSIVYFAAAIAAGVFYREFTKFNGFTGVTTLSFVHTHLFVLGMFLFLIAALFCKNHEGLSQNKAFKRFYILYNIALPMMACMLFVRGVLQVLGTSITTGMSAAISGISGIAHILITIAIVFMFHAYRSLED